MGARTMTMDPHTQTIYLPTEDLDPKGPTAVVNGKLPRLRFVNGTFKVLVVTEGIIENAKWGSQNGGIKAKCEKVETLNLRQAGMYVGVGWGRVRERVRRSAWRVGVMEA